MLKNVQNRGFSKFWGRKIFLIKKFFTLILEIFLWIFQATIPTCTSNRLVSRANFQILLHRCHYGLLSVVPYNGKKIFKIDIFVLKNVLNHSKSIPIQKIFSKNFRFFVPIFVILWPKNIFSFFGRKFLIFPPHFIRIVALVI